MLAVKFGSWLEIQKFLSLDSRIKNFPVENLKPEVSNAFDVIIAGVPVVTSFQWGNCSVVSFILGQSRYCVRFCRTFVGVLTVPLVGFAKSTYLEKAENEEISTMVVQ